MLALGRALWSHTPWEMTHDARRGELMFHYVTQQIRRRTGGFWRPLIGARGALCSAWDQDKTITCIDRITRVSFYLGLQLRYALPHLNRNVILYQ